MEKDGSSSKKDEQGKRLFPARSKEGVVQVGALRGHRGADGAR